MTAEKPGGTSLPEDLHPSPSAPDERHPKTMKQSDETTSDFEGGNASGLSASSVPADMQLFIRRQLRAVYDDVAKQPVPDRFLELMKQLEAKTSEA